jgi:hypothetical protein
MEHKMDRKSPFEVQPVGAFIPNSETLARFGIDCEESVARDLLVILSRVFAYGDSKMRTAVYQGSRLITMSVASEVMTDDEVLPALLPPLAVALPQGTTALNRLDNDHVDVTREWERRTPAIMAAFPLETMTVVLPAPAWIYLARFLECGPAEAQLRLNEAIKVRATEITAKSLRTGITCTWLIMRIIHELAQGVRANNQLRGETGRPLLTVSAALEKWTWLPTAPSDRSLIKLGASTEGWDTSAVPVSAIRQALKSSAREAEWGKWEPSHWPAAARWRALKRLVTLVLLTTVSPRVDHLRMFDVDDFAWRQFDDGEEAWGLRFRGELMKMRDGTSVYWKKLPMEAGEIIRAWISCSGRSLGQENEPLLTARRPIEGRPAKRYAYRSIIRFISGSHNPTGPSLGYPSGTRPLIAIGNSDWDGYASHRYRSFATQHVESLIHVWRLQNPGHPLSGVEPKMFAELMLDHGTRDMGYRDFTYGPRLEQILAVGISLVWESIWGDGATRKGIDVQRVADARESLEMKQAEAHALQHDIERHEQTKEEIKSKKSALIAKALKARGETREDLRFKADILRDNLDDLNDELTRALRHQVELTKRLDAAMTDLEQATTVEVALPDDLPEDVYQQQLAVALGAKSLVTPEWSPSMSDELTPHDLAGLFGVDVQTIWRWRTGRGRLPNPRPFEVEDWVEYHGKDHRLPVVAVRVGAIPAADPDAALAAVRRKRAVLGFRHGQASLAA